MIWFYFKRSLRTNVRRADFNASFPKMPQVKKTSASRRHENNVV